MTAKNILMPFAIFVCFSLVMSCTPKKSPPSPKPAPPARATTYDPCFIYPQDRDHFAVSCVWPSGDTLRLVRINSCFQEGGVETNLLIPNEGRRLITFDREADQHEVVHIANLLRRCIEETE